MSHCAQIRFVLEAPRLVLLLLGSVVLLSENTARADIAPDPLSGGTNLAIKGGKTNVAMVDEVVKLRVSRDACHVDVLFTMTNEGQAAETMQVGFPFFYSGELKDFKAVVDGIKIAAINEAGGRGEGGSLEEPVGWKPFWKLWKNTFEPGKPVKIQVTYWTKLTSGPWSWNLDQQKLPDLLTSLSPPVERADLEKRLDVRRVTYILRTGSQWSGPIGKCRIEVQFDGLSTDNLVLYQPEFEMPKAMVTRDRMTWDLENYEPKNDVVFRFTPAISRLETLKILERFQKQGHQNAVLTAATVEYLMAAGRQADAETALLKLLNDSRDKLVIFGPSGKLGLPLDESVSIFQLVRQIARTPSFLQEYPTDSPRQMRGPLPSFEPRHPRAFVPALQQMARNVKTQAKQAPQAETYYLDEADAILAWCEKQSK